MAVGYHVQVVVFVFLEEPEVFFEEVVHLWAFVGQKNRLPYAEGEVFLPA